MHTTMMRLYLSTHATMCVLLHFTLAFMPKIYIHTTCNNNSVCGGYKMPNVIAHEHTMAEREKDTTCMLSPHDPVKYLSLLRQFISIGLVSRQKMQR